MTEIPTLYQDLSSSSLHPPPAREDAQCYAQLSAFEMGILAFARLMDDASGNAVAEAPPFWLEPTAPLTTFSPKPTYATTGPWTQETMTPTTVDNATDWIAQQAFDWTLAPHSPTPSLSSFASTLSPSPSSPAPLTPDGFNTGFDLSMDCTAYQATLFDNPTTPFGLVDPMYHSSNDASYPTYSPLRQGAGYLPPISSISLSHSVTEHQPAPGAQRTSKKTRSRTSDPYDRASSHRRQHIAEHQRLNFPDERGKPCRRADRQPFATSAARHPGVQRGDHSVPPLGDPFGSWANRHGLSPPQSTLEEKPTYQIISSQRVESSGSAAPTPVRQKKSSGDPSTKPQGMKAANQPATRKPRRDDGFGKWGNPVPDELTFVQTDTHPQLRDRFMLFNGPPTPTAAQMEGSSSKPIRVRWN